MNGKGNGLMAWMRISVTFFVVAVLAFCVSVFASEETIPDWPKIALASTDHQTESSPASSVPHGEDSAKASHGQSDGHHGTHADLGKILPLWSCIPFAGMLLSIALCSLPA